MNTIVCTSCGTEIEIDKALEGQIEARVLAAERHKHADELEKAKAEAAAAARRSSEAAMKVMMSEAATELEIAKKQQESEILQAQKRAAAEHESLVKSLKDDAEHAKEDNKKMREELGKLVDQLRETNRAKDNAELEARKKMAEEEAKIREDATKQADEKQRLNIAALEKQRNDALKVNEELQRKLQQGSQQMQGEVLELDLEHALTTEFRDDQIVPVDKGVRGADIKHTVRSPLGNDCGVILWEIKRTKVWTEGWIQKLKDDLRDTKANIPVIITEVMPKDVKSEIHLHNGVWVAKPASAIILGTLLRKSLLDVAREKAFTKNRGTSAEAIHAYVTSHEFVQPIESMVEVYMEMISDVHKERLAYERLWAKRESQARKLLSNTANIIGSIQGQLGAGAMPRIKGLEMLESGEEDANAQATLL